MSLEDLESIERVRRTYGWPHRFEGIARCCFLVGRDLSFVRAFHFHYPFHQFWNAYSPFRHVPDTEISDLDELASLPTPVNR